MKLGHLIPLDHFQSGFTSVHGAHEDIIIHTPLDDKALGVHRVSTRTSHRLVEPPKHDEESNSELPRPTHAWEAFYPKGSINPKGDLAGGFGFYLAGPHAFSEALRDGATEVVLSYRMMLQDGWEWVKGGKLPGICEHPISERRTS